LKEAKGRCSLCGATKDERPLDVDHIIPLPIMGKRNIQIYRYYAQSAIGLKGMRTQQISEIIQREAREGCAFCDYTKSGEKLIEMNTPLPN